MFHSCIALVFTLNEKWSKGISKSCWTVGLFEYTVITVNLSQSKSIFLELLSCICTMGWVICQPGVWLLLSRLGVWGVGDLTCNSFISPGLIYLFLYFTLPFQEEPWFLLVDWCLYLLLSMWFICSFFHPDGVYLFLLDQVVVCLCGFYFWFSFIDLYRTHNWSQEEGEILWKVRLIF